MTQREITDDNNVRWTCVQAYAALNGEAADKAEEISTESNGLVPVVCTPSGGAQSVRLSLEKNWEAGLNDEDLLHQISKASSS